jgi:hypothetical protein
VLSLFLMNSANAQDPNLVGWWRLDEGSGNFAYDSSGFENNATLEGNPEWVDGSIGGALRLYGTGDYVDCGNNEIFDTTDELTLSIWVNTNDAGNGEHNPYISKGDHSYVLKHFNGNNIEFFVYSGGWRTATFPVDESFNGVWHHLAGTYNGTQVKLYIDGELRGTTNYTGAIEVSSDDINLGRNSEDTDRLFDGIIDDARIYNRALSEVEVSKLANPTNASTPEPADGSLVMETTVTLQWASGLSAVSHDVYFSDNFDDVNDATVETPDVYKGRQSGVQYPVDTTLSLELGMTYYWRVDEVEADGTTIYKGAVWSFRIQPLTAYDPSPADEAQYVDIDIDLTWGAGFNALSHDVYFGTDEAAVANADSSSPEFMGNQTELSYALPTLSNDTLYYWRVDEQNNDMTVSRGDVWQFETIPLIEVTDESLVGWWKLDDGRGSVALDWSGLGNHGTVVGDPQWVAGQIDGALYLDGLDDCVDVGNPESFGITAEISLLAWVKADAAGNGEEQSFVSKGNDSYAIWHNGGNNIEFRISDTTNAQTPVGTTFNDEWHHLAGTYDGRQLNLYIDGISRDVTSIVGSIATSVYNVNIGREATGHRYPYDGIIDDVRIYNRALPQEEISKVMRGDPLIAWRPNPVSGTIMDIEQHTGLLSWSSGDEAVEHDVYFGIDKDAVESADASDTTGVYIGRQDPNTYTLTDALQWDQTYYWRIDEIDADATISKGRVWSFTIADYLIVDDFEDYNDFGPDRIFDAWVDGWEILTNGSTVGYAEPDFIAGEHFVETNIVHGGAQSMPFFYDNDMKYSEATMTLVPGNDWTRQDVKILSLWYRGYPAYRSSFTEAPAGTFTIASSGADIWGTSDEFHFAYKQLAGPGSITAQVLSVENTHSSAKAGVMIRNTLDPDSSHAMMVVSPGAGVSFQRRTGTGDDSLDTTEGGVTAPQWVKLERSISGDFTASYSADGSSWTPMISETIGMNATVYIGLAVTAHNNEEVCEAVFSNVTTTGNVSQGPWMNQDIGTLSNAAEQMYVILNESAVVYNEDPNASLVTEWTEWRIDLQDFADQSVDLTNIESIGVGFGERNNQQAGGPGKIYFDDMRLYREETEPTP